MNLTNEKTIRFLKRNKALSMKTLEEESGLSHGLLNKVLKGDRSLNDSHLEKLRPVLQKYGYTEDLKNCRVISLVNQKGGVAKSTTAANLGAALALEGCRVLMIDLDAQANLTAHFGFDNMDENIYSALKGQAEDPIVEVRENLHLLPADIDLSAGEKEFNDLSSNFLLKKLIEPLREHYEYILIDCGPALGSLMTNALIASDQIIIPVSPEAFPVKGLKYLFASIDSVREEVNTNLRVNGILFTMYDGRLVVHKQNIEAIVQNFGYLGIYDTKIRLNVALKEAAQSGMDIFEYDKNSTGAKDYLNFANELING